jgi:hypothetical protein
MPPLTPLVFFVVNTTIQISILAQVRINSLKTQIFPFLFIKKLSVARLMQHSCWNLFISNIFSQAALEKF